MFSGKILEQSILKFKNRFLTLLVKFALSVENCIKGEGSCCQQGRTRRQLKNTKSWIKSISTPI